MFLVPVGTFVLSPISLLILDIRVLPLCVFITMFPLYYTKIMSHKNKLLMNWTLLKFKTSPCLKDTV